MLNNFNDFINRLRRHCLLEPTIDKRNLNEHERFVEVLLKKEQLEQELSKLRKLDRFFDFLIKLGYLLFLSLFIWFISLFEFPISNITVVLIILLILLILILPTEKISEFKGKISGLMDTNISTRE